MSNDVVLFHGAKLHLRPNTPVDVCCSLFSSRAFTLSANCILDMVSAAVMKEL